MSAGHYTSKEWHIIANDDGSFNIRHDSSYATNGVSELHFDPMLAAVEKLEVKQGDVVLVLVPEDMDSDMVNDVAESFSRFSDDLNFISFIVPNSLRFKVVHATEVQS